VVKIPGKEIETMAKKVKKTALKKRRNPSPNDLQ